MGLVSVVTTGAVGVRSVVPKVAVLTMETAHIHVPSIRQNVRTALLELRVKYIPSRVACWVCLASSSSSISSSLPIFKWVSKTCGWRSEDTYGQPWCLLWTISGLQRNINVPPDHPSSGVIVVSHMGIKVPQDFNDRFLRRRALYPLMWPLETLATKPLGSSEHWNPHHHVRVAVQVGRHL